MHSTLTCGIVILVLAFSLSASWDGKCMTCNNTINTKYNIDNDRMTHTRNTNNNNNINGNTSNAIQMIDMQWMYFALTLGIVIHALDVLCAHAWYCDYSYGNPFE
jgi:hypothetical protein